MASTKARVETGPFLAPTMVAALKRALGVLAGLAIIAVSVAAVTALFTYHPDDPSWNTSTDMAVRNGLLEPGALFSDAMLQSLGLAAAIPILVVAAWGGRVMRGETVSWLWLRTVSVPMAALLLAIGLAGITQPTGWALPSGLGGFSGQLLSDVAVLKLSAIGDPESVRWLLTALCCFAGLVLFHWVWTVPLTTYVVIAGRCRTEALHTITWMLSIFGRIRNERSARSAARAQTKAERRPAKNIEPTVCLDNDEDLAGTAATEDDLDIVDPKLSAFARTHQKAADIVVPRKPAAKPSKKELAARQGSLLPATPEGFELPPLDILTLPRVVTQTPIDTQSLESNAKMLEGVLQDFGIKGEVVKVRPGPVVTLYELEPAPGTKTARVVSLADDIARSMSAVAVRIAVVPGRSVIGIELPNERRETVYFREMLSSDACDKFDGKLTLALGKDIGGAPIYADLARMPHLLIAGTTGSGKSVAINTMIMSLLYRHTPDDVRLLMIDPKMLELSVYDGIPHLLSPVVTEPTKAVVALKWVVREMEDRYRAMSQLSVRNIAGYNQRLQEAAKKGKSASSSSSNRFPSRTPWSSSCKEESRVGVPNSRAVSCARTRVEL